MKNIRVVFSIIWKNSNRSLKVEEGLKVGILRKKFNLDEDSLKFEVFSFEFNMIDLSKSNS